MVCFEGSFVLQIVGVITALVVVVLTYLKWNQSYWKKMGFPYYPLGSLFFGNSDSFFKWKFRRTSLKIKDFYDTMKQKGVKHFGIFLMTRPVYIPIDLDYVKNIICKDFDHFVDRGHYFNEKDDPISAHLFNLGGTKWRNLRAKLSPTFTSGKIKILFGTLVECGRFLSGAMEKMYEENQPVDIKEVLRCFSIDVIGSCAFGLECKSFEDKDSPFRIDAKKVLMIPRTSPIKRELAGIVPNFSRKIGITFGNKDAKEFFTNLIRNTLDYRRKNNIIRNDFLQLLINLTKQEIENIKDGSNSLSFNEIVAQCFVFFLAGFETSSSTLTFAFYELGANSEIQEKLRREVYSVLEKHHGAITYDSIMDMKYMNQVIDETLRKYPAVPVFERVCTKDYQIPGTDLELKKGIRVFIPILAIHKDPDYYPEPDTFDPERFSKENNRNRHPYAHIPFGKGPRTCIGRRFGIMQTKVALALLLKNYKFTVSAKTSEPLEMSRSSVLLVPKRGVWLDVKKI